MQNNPKNPPAFACASENGYQEGMTLRDYFAAAALPAFLVNNDSTYEQDAERAYKSADAMLKVRGS